MPNTISIRVETEDVELMMSRCRDIMLEQHPELEGVEISRRFMFKKIVKFALGEK